MIEILMCIGIYVCINLIGWWAVRRRSSKLKYLLAARRKAHGPDGTADDYSHYVELVGKRHSERSQNGRRI